MCVINAELMTTTITSLDFFYVIFSPSLIMWTVALLAMVRMI